MHTCFQIVCQFDNAAMHFFFLQDEDVPIAGNQKRNLARQGRSSATYNEEKCQEAVSAGQSSRSSGSHTQLETNKTRKPRGRPRKRQVDTQDAVDRQDDDAGGQMPESSRGIADDGLPVLPQVGLASCQGDEHSIELGGVAGMNVVDELPCILGFELQHESHVSAEEEADIYLVDEESALAAATAAFVAVDEDENESALCPLAAPANMSGDFLSEPQDTVVHSAAAEWSPLQAHEPAAAAAIRTATASGPDATSLLPQHALQEAAPVVSPAPASTENAASSELTAIAGHSLFGGAARGKVEVWGGEGDAGECGVQGGEGAERGEITGGGRVCGDALESHEIVRVENNTLDTHTATNAAESAVSEDVAQTNDASGDDMNDTRDVRTYKKDEPKSPVPIFARKRNLCRRLIVAPVEERDRGGTQKARIGDDCAIQSPPSTSNLLDSGMAEGVEGERDQIEGGESNVCLPPVELKVLERATVGGGAGVSAQVGGWCGLGEVVVENGGKRGSVLAELQRDDEEEKRDDTEKRNKQETRDAAETRDDAETRDGEAKINDALHIESSLVSEQATVGKSETVQMVERMQTQACTWSHGGVEKVDASEGGSEQVVKEGGEGETHEELHGGGGGGEEPQERLDVERKSVTKDGGVGTGLEDGTEMGGRGLHSGQEEGGQEEVKQAGEGSADDQQSATAGVDSHDGSENKSHENLKKPAHNRDRDVMSRTQHEGANIHAQKHVPVQPLHAEVQAEQMQEERDGLGEASAHAEGRGEKEAQKESRIEHEEGAGAGEEEVVLDVGDVVLNGVSECDLGGARAAEEREHTRTEKEVSKGGGGEVAEDVGSVAEGGIEEDSLEEMDAGGERGGKGRGMSVGKCHDKRWKEQGAAETSEGCVGGAEREVGERQKSEIKEGTSNRWKKQGAAETSGDGGEKRPLRKSVYSIAAAVAVAAVDGSAEDGGREDHRKRAERPREKSSKTPSPTRTQKQKQRPCKLETLLQAGLVLPGKKVLRIERKGELIYGDLLPDGVIRYSADNSPNLDMTFESPTGFCNKCMRLLDTSFKHGNGFTYVMYSANEGQTWLSLDHYRAQLVGHAKNGQETTQRSNPQASKANITPIKASSLVRASCRYGMCVCICA